MDNLEGDTDPPKPWVPPSGFWRAVRPETLALNGNARSPADGTMGRTKPAGAPGGQRGSWGDLQRSDSLESHLHRCVQKDTGPGAPPGGLWRADSWESVCGNGGSLTLAERVEMNRGILRRILNEAQSSYRDSIRQAQDVSQGTIRGSTTLNDSDWDSGISLQDSEHSHRSVISREDLSLSPRHEQAKRILERARMKTRSSPVKADHTLLPVQRDNAVLLSASGAPWYKDSLLVRDGLAVVSGNLSDSSSGDSACGSRRRPGHSPTRVRFQDESERDAEARYLERQQRQRPRAGERAQGLLVSKPRLSSYIKGLREGDGSPEGTPSSSRKKRATHGELQGGTHKDTLQEVMTKKCGSCGTFLEGVVASHLNLVAQAAPGDAVSRSQVIPRWIAPARTSSSEQIKETHIGEVTSADEPRKSSHSPAGEAQGGGTGGTGQIVSILATSKKKCLKKEDGGLEEGQSPSEPQGQNVGLPSYRPTPPAKDRNSLGLNLKEQTTMLNRGEDNPSLLSPHSPVSPLRNLQLKAHPEITGLGQHLQANGDCQDDAGLWVTVPLESPSGYQGMQWAEQQLEDDTKPVHTLDPHRRVVIERSGARDGRPKLSLRRIFSAIGLTGTGWLRQGHSSGSERLSSSPRHGSPCLSPSHSPRGQLKKTPSLQSMAKQGVPIIQLRRASSVQELPLLKVREEHAAENRLGVQLHSPDNRRGLQRALSVEDVGRPSGARSVGRVAQAFPDGTLLLELCRPAHGPFGFVISRGNGRLDSGVYVERMGDSGTEKLYAGLLGVGDEILEVNGEKVAGLGLNQVTRLMRQDSIASIRILRHRRPRR
ncbi:uncharacterized protein KIAA1614-like [Megalops cyprinoides]|uniref:uncharacterized protein KIAA1614-like n=1 Tax=Megalops cyprinoides TaxID=118141 RepID=UPI001863E4C8|nr:uncharacterized protein KIAA1614-like [Megalops cyprinoides]